MAYLGEAKWTARPATSVGLRYGLALGSVAAALGLAHSLQHFRLPQPFTAFALCAIAITFWYGGTVPGILAGFLSALVRSCLFQPETNAASSSLDGLEFLIFAVLMNWVTRVRNELEVRVEERTAGLIRINEELKLEIAERKRAEEALRLFRTLIDQSNDAIEVLDPSTLRFLDMNQKGCADLAYTLDEILSLTAFDVDPMLDHEAYIGSSKQLRESGFLIKEGIHLRKNGSTFPVELNIKLIQLESRVYVVTVARDITERKRTEEALRLFRTLIDQTNDAIEVIDPDTLRFLDMNQKGCADHGYTREEILSLTVFDIDPTLDHDAHIRVIKQLRESGSLIKEGIHLRKDGSTFPAEINIRLIQLESGEYIVAVARDITERKRAEEALRTSERDHRRIAEQLERERARLVEAQEVAKIGSWEAELQSLNVIWSEQTHRIFETDPSWFHPTRPKFTEFVHPEDRTKVDAAFIASLDKPSPCTIEYRIVMPDGRVKFLEERWQTFHDEQGKAVRVAGTCRDITERVRAGEELRELSGRLLRLRDEERREIARDLHDSTGQNLVALAMMLDQLRRSVPSVERKSLELISECKALADQCIREVRTLSYVLHPPVLDEAGLEEAIRDYVDGFTKRSGIYVELELSPRVGRIARDLELTLFRIVQEALANIQRHSGSQRAEIRIHRNSDLTLEISDFGRGISTSKNRGKQESRFEIGVGIPSMQERVKLIGGRLDIDFTGHGTTVRVTLPLGGEPA
jgi:PAS domain S-box-containing protein